jgi:hypothetical protein
MEVLDKNLAILKSQSWNQTSKEISKICEYLGQVLEMLGQGKNIQPYLSSIVENCLNSGSARNIRKLAYLIVRQAGSLYDIPWGSVSACVNSDLGTSTDPEFQVYSLRMLYILPLELTISTFLAHETVILAAVQGKFGDSLQTAFLNSLPGILIRIWCGLSSENYELQDAVKEIFKFIVSLVLDPDEKLCILAFGALNSLFQESEEAKLRGLSQELSANGSDFELLSPLIHYLCWPHSGQINLIIHRVMAFDFRIRVKMIYALTKLVIWGQNDCEKLRLERECLVPLLGSLEKGVVWQVAKCLNLLKAETSTIWTMCNSLLGQMRSEANPTPLLLLVMDGMTALPVSQQLSLALETLKHANRIQSRVDRFSVLLSSLNSIVVLSKLLLDSKEQSAIYQLFSQTWFVELWMSSHQVGFREDLLCCLVETCLCNHEESDSWLTVGLEVIDVCFKVLDWPCELNSTICFNYFFLLFEEVCIISKKSRLVDRVQQTLENLLNRLTLDSCSQLNQYAFHLSMLVCSKYWLPQNEEMLKHFMELLRIRLFSAEHLPIQVDIAAQCMTFLVCSCFHLARRFCNQAFEGMLRNLDELHEVYENMDKNTDFISKVLEILRMYRENSAIIDNEYQGYYSMFIERVHINYDEETEIRYDSMHAALNIFRSRRNECFNSERPLELLRIVQPSKELNWRCLTSQEITGLCDPLRSFVTHVIYPQ